VVGSVVALLGNLVALYKKAKAFLYTVGLLSNLPYIQAAPIGRGIILNSDIVVTSKKAFGAI